MCIAFCEVINPYQTPEKTLNIHRGLNAAQHAPILGILPAAIQLIFSLGQLLASGIAGSFRAQQGHHNIAVGYVQRSLTNLVSFGLYIPFNAARDYFASRFA